MWWSVVVVLLLLAAGVYGFVVLTKTMTRRLSSRTDRTAENLYDSHSKPPRRRRHKES